MVNGGAGHVFILTFTPQCSMFTCVCDNEHKERMAMSTTPQDVLDLITEEEIEFVD